mmetsp:Transcript_47568/g.97269  ORF Transcript_47568/g.97269 Transcript_47568/m.97269 type:complete len:283 (-) Transcript_47568:172-1020(-)
MAVDWQPKKLLYHTPRRARTTGMLALRGASTKCLSIACAPASSSSNLSMPTLSAIDVPTALHSEYRPPTQSQKPSMLSVAIPNFSTAGALVLMATKCLATAASSFSASTSHCLAVPAFIIVSCVVNVLEHTRKRVVSGSSPLSVSVTCVPSTLETNFTSSSVAYDLSASVTMTGPRSEPPMPMLTACVNFLPVKPTRSPDRTWVTKERMRARTSLTAGMTSAPSTRIGVLERLRSATCSTGRPSVVLITAPLNIASLRSATPASCASATRSCMVSSVIRFLL